MIIYAQNSRPDFFEHTSAVAHNLAQTAGIKLATANVISSKFVSKASRWKGAEAAKEAAKLQSTEQQRLRTSRTNSSNTKGQDEAHQEQESHIVESLGQIDFTTCIKFDKSS